MVHIIQTKTITWMCIAILHDVIYSIWLGQGRHMKKARTKSKRRYWNTVLTRLNVLVFLAVKTESGSKFAHFWEDRPLKWGSFKRRELETCLEKQQVATLTDLNQWYKVTVIDLLIRIEAWQSLNWLYFNLNFVPRTTRTIAIIRCAAQRNATRVVKHHRWM